MFVEIIFPAVKLAMSWLHALVYGWNPEKSVKYVKQKIPIEIRDQVWLKYNGAKTVGQCFCCKTKIGKYKGGWHCAHVVAERNGGKTEIENLRPTCRSCNLKMGTKNLYEFKNKKKNKSE